MTLINVGYDDGNLLSVESSAYDSVEVHQMKVVDGLMKINHLTVLVIPARGQVQFAPGGMHLMLMGPHAHLATGDKVDMTLTFSIGQKQTVTVTVAAR